ncbi:MAG: UbiA prenyltransferase family protein [Verrucomicrobia bacterium]|nr:UbiA prenyltransferase family protein [Verrucomicrobiota bacterium]
MNLTPYIQIARVDHWIKNVFILPGIVLALFFYPRPVTGQLLIDILIGLLAACLTASSNYVINEILDAERDRHHPVKKERPIPSGHVSIPVAYAEWILLGIAGSALGFWVNASMGWACVFLWFMGTLYNIPPIRMKDMPYADVLSESINNPIRMAMGWFSTGLVAMPTMSIMLSYWMFGAFLMATKRFAEYRSIGDPERAAKYRSSFKFYNEERLLTSILFYASLFAMFAAVFITRYKLEVILATPIVAYAMAYYLHLGFKEKSPAQYPERLFREKKLMLICLAAFLACGGLLFVELPSLEQFLVPWHKPPV